MSRVETSSAAGVASGLSSEVELFFALRAVIKCDVSSNSDPFCALFAVGPGGLSEVGRTETLVRAAAA